MTLPVLILRYSAFAAIAMVVNLAAQRLVLTQDTSAIGYAVALVTGTVVGLLVKYLLDKRWIFYDASNGLRSHGRKFTLYTAMGVFTTLIFWGTETAFWTLWRSDALRELGAVIGLVVGYVIKYNLDRRYVFTDGALVPKGNA